jgi:hypothetical protein
VCGWGELKVEEALSNRVLPSVLWVGFRETETS